MNANKQDAGGLPEQMSRFVAASIAAGYGEPQKGLHGDAFLYQRDADRFAGFQMSEGNGEQCGAASGDREALATRLRELICEYWDLAYDEGVDKRNSDTPAGDANRVANEIEIIIRALSRGVPEGERYPPDVVRVIDDFASGDVNCPRCNRKISLYFNGGELDAEECCGLRFTTEPNDGYCLVIRDAAIAAQRKEGV